jgi:hypothetical protein
MLASRRSMVLEITQKQIYSLLLRRDRVVPGGQRVMRAQ